jgi:hypothetical protein
VLVAGVGLGVAGGHGVGQGVLWTRFESSKESFPFGLSPSSC